MKSKKDDLTNLNILEELNRKVQIKKDKEEKEFPMAIDSSRPFPLIQNKTLNIAALIKSRGEDKKEKKK